MSDNTVDLHALALRAGVFGVVEREAKAAKDAAREQLMAALPFGDTVAGRVGDEIVCKAGWSKGSSKLVVTDERAFLEWVKENHPTEVVESVNSAYLASLKQVEGTVIDADGLPVDGVEVVTGKPSLSVRSETNALEIVARMVADGQVTLGGLKELAAAPEVQSYSLAEVRNGTGWPNGVRFVAQVDAPPVDDDVIDAEVVE